MDTFRDSVLVTGWYTVRCVFETDAADAERVGYRLYEERLMLWRAGGFDEAIAFAESDAREYAQTVGSAYLGIAQCSRSDVPEHGAEVYSLMRESALPPEAYVNVFFDSGSERQQRSD